MLPVQTKYVLSLLHSGTGLFGFIFVDILQLKESFLFAEKLDLVIDWMSKFSKKADGYAKSIRDHGNFPSHLIPMPFIYVRPVIDNLCFTANDSELRHKLLGNFEGKVQPRREDS